MQLALNIVSHCQPVGCCCGLLPLIFLTAREIMSAASQDQTGSTSRLVDVAMQLLAKLVIPYAGPFPSPFCLLDSASFFAPKT